MEWWRRCLKQMTMTHNRASSCVGWGVAEPRLWRITSAKKERKFSIIMYLWPFISCPYSAVKKMRLIGFRNELESSFFSSLTHKSFGTKINMRTNEQICMNIASISLYRYACVWQWYCDIKVERLMVDKDLRSSAFYVVLAQIRFLFFLLPFVSVLPMRPANTKIYIH